MAFTTTMTTTAEVDDSIVLEFDTQFILAAAQMQVMDQFVSYKKQIGAKSIDFPKYNQLALATTPLDEDDDVSSEALGDSQILLTPAEHGNVVTTTKLANLQTGGKADLAAARLVGMNLGRTLNKLASNALEASANSFTVDGGAEAALDAADVMTTAFLNVLYNKLARQSILPLANDMYVAIMHDDVIHDLRASVGSGSWQDIKKQTSADEILKNQVGMASGFMIVRNNDLTINTDGGSGTVDTYKTICLGFNGLGKAISEEPHGTLTGPFDKLGRFVNVGWYGTLQYGIVDTDAVQVGITASSVGANT